MKKELEREPELRLLLEDYSATEGRVVAADSESSFSSEEPHFLVEQVGERSRRWLEKHGPRIDHRRSPMIGRSPATGWVVFRPITGLRLLSTHF